MSWIVVGLALLAGLAGFLFIGAVIWVVVRESAETDRRMDDLR